MAELVLTATDTVFHDINLKSGYPDDGGRLLSGKETRSSYRDREMTEEDLAIFREDTNLKIDSDEEWDTDLEDEGYRYRYRYSRNEDPNHVYLAACKQLNIVPASRFMKGIETRTMNLNNQGLGPLGVRAVATGLVVDRRATCLTLAGNFIGHDGVRYLCEMLRENDIITELDLSENDIDSQGVQVLSELFRINDSVAKLSLSGNRLKGSDAVYLSNVLTLPSVFRAGNLHGLKIFDLSHNELGDEGAQIIGHAIADNEVLLELNLSWNQIRKPGILCLAKGIGENNCLKKVDISTNGISNDGAQAIGKALENNRTLEELNLNSNRIGLTGITYLFTSIAKNDNLRVIRLSNNPLTYQGPTAALKLLQQSESSVLEEIEIADACVPREFFQLLEEVQAVKPQFKVHIGGFMDSKDMFKAEIKNNKESWNKDPVLVFISFIEEQRIRIVDMFKSFDTDRSLMVSVDEFKHGLTNLGCPLNDKQLEQVIRTLDTDENGEIDLEEFFEGHFKHKRRLEKLLNYGSRSVSRMSSEKQDPSEQVSRSSSRQSFEDNSRVEPDSRQSIDRRPSQFSDYTTESERESATPGGLIINLEDGFLEPPRPATTPQIVHSSSTEPLQDVIIPVPTSLTVL